MKQTIVVELAGRDSVVALFKFLEECHPNDKYNFILSVVCVPTEDETNTMILDLGEVFKVFIESKGHTVKGMFYSNDVRECWFNLINKPQEMINTYAFYSPCIACHALCHVYRAKICLKNGSTKIITGERVLHEGKYKVNQDRLMLDAYDEYIGNTYGVSLVRPIIDMTTEEVAKRYEAICNNLSLDISTKDMFTKCYMSNNWNFDPLSINSILFYFKDYLVPKLDKIIDLDIATGNSDLNERSEY